MAFDYAGLKAAFRTSALILGTTGKPLNINLDTLVVTRGYAPHNRALEILGALNRGWIPGSADRDQGGLPAGYGSPAGATGVATYKIIANPWTQTNTGYWWMFDSRMKNPRYGLQYKESQPITLEGPNVVFKTGEIQYKAKHHTGLEKSSLIYGENPVVDYAFQAEKQEQRLSERNSLCKRVYNSLNTVYNTMKTVSCTEMLQSAL